MESIDVVRYIEGSQKTNNGNLKNAFGKLLEKELYGEMPKIVMGNGKNQTMDKFFCKPQIKNGNSEIRFLLLDSDKIVENKEIHITNITNVESGKYKSTQYCSDKNIYFMIQAVESWILSQPEILQRKGLPINKIPQCHPEKVSSPKQVIVKIYESKGKTYHEVSDCSDLLQKIDTRVLKETFTEFNALIEAIKEANKLKKTINYSIQ